MSDTLEVDPREVISDFMLQGHLSYETVGRASDYDRTDAMIRDLAAEGVAIISAAKLATLQREADEMREALREAVAYADGVSWADGMPIDKQAKRLTFYCATDDGAEYEGVWDVSKARAFVSDGTPQEADSGDNKP